MTTDDERIAYLAGDDSATVDDSEHPDLDELRDLLADPSTWIEPPAHLEDAVVAAIAAERTSAAPVVPERPAVIPIRSRRRRARVLIGTAAAAAAAVVAVAVMALDAPGPTADLAATLEPTELAATATGEATFTKTSSGWRIELHAELPRLDGGRFYEAWLKGDDDALVSIGTFNEGDDVVLWAGVSPVDHPTITVTEEADDGDAASSGRRVLVGSISTP